jgi:hypothetical protein
MDVPLSVENWLSLGTHSFLCGLGSVFAYWWTRRVLMFVLSSWDSAFRFDFACTFALLIAQFTGLIPFWIFFSSSDLRFRVLIYETFGLIPFGLTYLCEVSLRSFLGFKIFFDVIFFPAVSGSSSLVQNRMYLIFSDILSCILKYFPQWWLLPVFVFMTSDFEMSFYRSEFHFHSIFILWEWILSDCIPYCVFCYLGYFLFCSEIRFAYLIFIIL